MVEIKGKRRRKVPVLLTTDMQDAVKLLVGKRECVGIRKENPFVFARPSETSLNHLRHWECLHKLTNDESLCLQHPEAITSTRLRKYIATVSQVLDLDKKELDWLARHMGHDIEVHREYYRLHESTIELAKVSKILAVVDEGNISKWVGKPLDEIQVDINDESSDNNTSEEEEDLQPTQPINLSGTANKGNMKKSSIPAKNNRSGSRKNSTQAKTQRRKVTHKIWSSSEKAAVFKHLGNIIKKKQLPGKMQCLECIRKSKPLLDDRDWTAVKYFVKNVISRAERLTKNGV